MASGALTGVPHRRDGDREQDESRPVVEQALAIDERRSASGTGRRLNVATTAAGSVAETIAPTMNARSKRSPVATVRTTATTAAEMRTPGTANRSKAPNQRRNSTSRSR